MWWVSVHTKDCPYNEKVILMLQNTNKIIPALKWKKKRSTYTAECKAERCYIVMTSLATNSLHWKQADIPLYGTVLGLSVTYQIFPFWSIFMDFLKDMVL